MIEGTMHRLLLSTAITAAVFTTGAYAAPTIPAPSAIYPGCAVPAVTGKTWYVSPSGDDATGDGTQAKPWTLASVTRAGAWGGPRLNSYPYSVKGAWITNAAGPIHPGDLVVLLPGNYGVFILGVFGQPANTGEYVTFAADPSGKAVVSKIQINQKVSKVRVTGVTVRGDGVTSGSLVDLNGYGSDLTVDHVDAATVEDAESIGLATTADWEKNVNRNGINLTTVNCANVTDNKFHNVMTGVGISNANKSTVSYNEIAFHTRDGVDVGGNDILLDYNFIHDVIVSSTLHMDIFQGFGPTRDGSPVQYSNGQYEHIRIHGNRGYRQLDPRNKFATYVQGIDAFDGAWKNIEITDNLIVSTSCWGVSWGTTSYGLYAHNTIVYDGSKGGNPSGCQPGLSPFTNTHEFTTGSDHIVAAYNIAASGNFVPDSSDGKPYVLSTRNNVAVNNLLLSGLTYFDEATLKVVYRPTKAGVWQGNTWIANKNPTNVFVNANQTLGGYGPFNLHLKSGSPAIGLGPAPTAALDDLQKVYPNLRLPETDIEGKRFDLVKPEAGAYAY